MVHHELELDSAVRDWVFIPLTLSILLMKLLTQYAHMVSPGNAPTSTGSALRCARQVTERGAGTDSPDPRAHCLQLTHQPTDTSNKDPKELREQQGVMRAQRLRQAGRVIPENGYKMRKEYFVAKVGGRSVTRSRHTLAHSQDSSPLCPIPNSCGFSIGDTSMAGGDRVRTSEVGGRVDVPCQCSKRVIMIMHTHPRRTPVSSTKRS